MAKLGWNLIFSALCLSRLRRVECSITNSRYFLSNSCGTQYKIKSHLTNNCTLWCVWELASIYKIVLAWFGWVNKMKMAVAVHLHTVLQSLGKSLWSLWWPLSGLTAQSKVTARPREAGSAEIQICVDEKKITHLLESLCWSHQTYIKCQISC